MFRSLTYSFKALFKKPVTRNYPAEKLPKATNYRGLIRWEREKCNACFLCDKNCPPGAIAFTQDIVSGGVEFHLNPYLCIYCGECVRACPDKCKALTQSEDLAPPGLKSDRINESWEELKKKALESQLAYRAAKKNKAPPSC